MWCKLLNFSVHGTAAAIVAAAAAAVVTAIAIDIISALFLLYFDLFLCKIGIEEQE